MNDYLQVIHEKVEDAIRIVYEYKAYYPEAENLAVVFDIDGTLLNDDEPILPVVNFYNICKSLGYSLFIVTARDSNGTQETIDQLYKMNITDYVSIYLRLPIYWDMTKYKTSCRESIVNKGYNVVLSIGDSEWDIGQYGGYGILLPQLAF